MSLEPLKNQQTTEQLIAQIRDQLDGKFVLVSHLLNQLEEIVNQAEEKESVLEEAIDELIRDRDWFSSQLDKAELDRDEARRIACTEYAIGCNPNRVEDSINLKREYAKKLNWNCFEVDKYGN